MEREREKGEIYRRVRDRKGVRKREGNREEMEIYVMYILGGRVEVTHRMNIINYK